MKKALCALLAVVMTGVMCLGFTGCQNKSGGTFTVGFDKEFPPMGFVDKDGNYVGFDLDLAQEVAKRLGLEYKAQPIEWDFKTTELSTGNIDCVWNGFTMTGREDEYTWSKPYLNNQQVFIVLTDATYTDKASLAGTSVAVQEDSSAQAAVNDDKNKDFKATLKEVISTPTNLNALMELDTGKVNAVLMDEVVARYNIEQNEGKYKLLEEPLAAEKYAIGFNLGNTELRDKVDKALQEMTDDGTMAKISEKWFGKDITIFGK